MEFPFDMPFDIINVDNDADFVAAVVSINEVDTRSISKEASPCRQYSAETSDVEMSLFVDCCRKRMSETYPAAIGCRLAGFDFILPENVSLPGCKNRTEAEAVFDALTGGLLSLIHSQIHLLLGTHTVSHTHSLSLSLSHTHTLSLSHAHTHYVPL